MERAGKRFAALIKWAYIRFYFILFFCFERERGRSRGRGKERIPSGLRAEYGARCEA